MRLLAFLDESGRFTLEDGHVDGMGLLVVPNEPSALRAIKEHVETVEAIAGPEERIRGKVKGSHLLPERVPGLLELLRDIGAKFSPLTAEQRRKGGQGQDLMLVASRIASVSKSMGREARGLQIAMSLLDISASPRFYCSFAYQLVRFGLLADLRSLGVEHVEIVYDERLDKSDCLTLDVAVSVALAEILKMNPNTLLEGLLGGGSLPWTVRPEAPDDHCPLQLTDWLLYPQVVVHRKDVSEGHQAKYRVLCDLYEQLDVVVYPLREAGRPPNAP